MDMFVEILQINEVLIVGSLVVHYDNDTCATQPMMCHHLCYVI